MIVRSERVVVAMLWLAVAAPVGAEVIIIGIKGAMVDCFSDALLAKQQATIRKADWPSGPVPAGKVTEDVVYVEVAGKQCWLDRSDLKFAVPDAASCVTKSGEWGTRGLGGECRATSQPDRR